MSSHASCEPVVFLVEHDGLPARLRFASGVTVLLEATDPALCAFVADIYDLVPDGTEHTYLDDQWDRLLDGGAV